MKMGKELDADVKISPEIFLEFGILCS